MNADRLADQLVADEGLRLKPYRCTAGKLTIGVGRNLDDVGITEVEALALLNNDIERVWSQTVRGIPWISSAPGEVQEVVANMVFNMGIAGVLGFKTTLEALKAGDYRRAAAAMLDSKWAKQVGPRAERLSHRVKALA